MAEFAYRPLLFFSSQSWDGSFHRPCKAARTAKNHANDTELPFPKVQDFVLT